jgi:hypothetical protein
MIVGHLYPGKFNGTCNRFFTLENLYLGLETFKNVNAVCLFLMSYVNKTSIDK